MPANETEVLRQCLRQRRLDRGHGALRSWRSITLHAPCISLRYCRHMATVRCSGGSLQRLPSRGNQTGQDCMQGERAQVRGQASQVIRQARHHAKCHIPGIAGGVIQHRGKRLKSLRLRQ